MFCPRCKAEYRDGVYECPECEVELEEELPVEEVEYVRWVQILSVCSAADVALVKSLLEAEGIRYFIPDEHSQLVRPLAESARIMVLPGQFLRARELLSQVELQYSETGERTSPDASTENEDP